MRGDAPRWDDQRIVGIPVSVDDFCWSARDFCSLLEDEGREKGRGQGPDGDFALLLRQILVELLPVGGERR